jgi:hypothetical protein
MISVELNQYKKLVGTVGSLSNLFSDNESVFLNSRFVEKLYVHNTNAIDYSRKDMSFDAKLDSGAGVGVKTFLASNAQSVKSEKIAEFTAAASLGEFLNLTPLEAALKVANFRNSRVESDARIYEIDLDKSFYHCLIRTNLGCMVHEEPLRMIEIDKIRLTANGNDKKSHIEFEDGLNKYTFNASKNTLYKAFDLQTGDNSPIFQVNVIENVLDHMAEGNLTRELGVLAQKKGIELSEFEKAFSNVPGIDFIVLPLYSTRTRQVPERSGINQWNASGRERQFGEGYIPIPIEVRRKCGSFLPEIEEIFNLNMPNGRLLKSKVCQQDGKALMSNPNKDLCEWLFKLIDSSEWTSRKRLTEHRPYTYDDLIMVGKDSVKITKSLSRTNTYDLEPMPIGSYEKFIVDLNL